MAIIIASRNCPPPAKADTAVKRYCAGRVAMFRYGDDTPVVGRSRRGAWIPKVKTSGARRHAYPVPASQSAQGAKGAVAADGPQTPSRVQINKAMMGFLTHCGYSHGGNGFEGMAFLIEQFRNVDLTDPTEPEHELDLDAMAMDFARQYNADKAAAKEVGGEVRAFPCVHHPVFKDKPVNHDPRERFIAKFMEERGAYNIFHD